MWANSSFLSSLLTYSTYRLFPSSLNSKNSFLPPLLYNVSLTYLLPFVQVHAVRLPHLTCPTSSIFLPDLCFLCACIQLRSKLLLHVRFAQIMQEMTLRGY